MNDLFLGVIAAAVVVMAIVQIATIVMAARAARRMGEAVSRIEQDVRPIVANLQSLSAEARPVLANLQTLVSDAQPVMASLQTLASDAARATSIAAAQVERAERSLNEFIHRLEGIVTSLQSTLTRPARQGFAVLQGLRMAFNVFRDRAPREAPGRRRGTTVEEEDALFIG